MKNKILIIILLLSSVALNIKAQIGIRAGVNIANQTLYSNQPDFNVTSLTGFQIGLVYQAMPQSIGFGLESGLLFSQKGNMFQYDGEQKKGYNELNYLEIPLNLRYKFTFGPLGVYAYAGLYGSYLIHLKNIFDGENNEPKVKLGDFLDRVDYGYGVGAGIELLKKVQLGVNWSGGFKDISHLYQSTPMEITSGKNRLFSVNLVLLF